MLVVVDALPLVSCFVKSGVSQLHSGVYIQVETCENLLNFSNEIGAMVALFLKKMLEVHDS